MLTRMSHFLGNKYGQLGTSEHWQKDICLHNNLGDPELQLWWQFQGWDRKAVGRMQDFRPWPRTQPWPTQELAVFLLFCLFCRRWRKYSHQDFWEGHQGMVLPPCPSLKMGLRRGDQVVNGKLPVLLVDSGWMMVTYEPISNTSIEWNGLQS